MQLTYRGTPHQTSIAQVDTPQSNLTGHYRGLTTQLSQPIQVAPSPHPLKYRGIPYNTTAIATVADRPNTTAIVTRVLRVALLLTGAVLTASIATL